MCKNLGGKLFPQASFIRGLHQLYNTAQTRNIDCLHLGPENNKTFK
jgi:hypothetical protein